MKILTNRNSSAVSIIVFVVLISATLYLLHCVQYNQKQPDSVVKICTGKIWLEAVKKTGDFPFATFEGDTLCLAGGIFPDGVDSAIRIINNNKIKNIVISSTGGSAGAAMDLADEIINNGIDIYVQGPCFSSCANYIFMAGANKYIVEGGVVAWHGAPRHRDGASEKVKKVAMRHKQFFSRIGVDERITRFFPCDLQNDPIFINAINDNSETRGVFWTYTASSMRSDFNVHNLIMLWQPKSTSELRAHPRFADTYKNVFLANGCGR